MSPPNLQCWCSPMAHNFVQADRRGYASTSGSLSVSGCLTRRLARTMHPNLLRSFALALSGVIALVAAGYCLLWAFSASSLAFVACNGEYSLFAESFRCKQPVLAVYGMWFFAILGVACLIGTWVYASRGRSAG